MATLKHIPSKNADYGKTLEYLMFEHTEGGTPVRDEEGNMVMRDQFLLDGINCTPYFYDKECEMLNWQYHKNLKPEDVKSHHYIISFDPQDKAEGLLTPEHAHKLGMEFAARFFPGHQILVCTHNDGHNASGNIHVHICFNSLRKLDVEKQPFMERDIDSRAGYKHHPNKKTLKYLKGELMKMCEREGLHQIDLLSPAKSRVTDEEYRAAQHGQEKLDKLNEEIVATKMKPARTTFQTQKQYLRDAILDAASHSSTLEDFKKMLLEKYRIKLKDHRGRFSYLHPDRRKYITDRALGAEYRKEAVLDRIKENVHEKENVARDTAIQERTDYDPAYDYQADPIAILHIRSNLRLVVDLQTCVKAQMNEAYAQKVKISNLKEMARTIAFIQEQGIDSREELLLQCDSIEKKAAGTEDSICGIEDNLRQTNEQIHFAGQYYTTRSVHNDFLKSWNKGWFRARHQSELTKYDEAIDFFREHTGGTIPSMKALKERKVQLVDLKEKRKEELRQLSHSRQILQTVISNVDAILSDDDVREMTNGQKTQIYVGHPRPAQQKTESRHQPDPEL